MKRHWGEIEKKPDANLQASSLSSLEREKLTKFSTNRPFDVEGPRLHQPSSRHYPPAAESVTKDL